MIRLVRESGLQRVLAILDAWEKIERRHQVKVIKGILGTLSHVCDSSEYHNLMALCRVYILPVMISS